MLIYILLIGGNKHLFRSGFKIYGVESNSSNQRNFINLCVKNEKN